MLVSGQPVDQRETTSTSNRPKPWYALRVDRAHWLVASWIALVVFATPAVVLGALRIRRRWRTPRVVVARDTLRIVGFAALDAQQRGHDVVSLAHVVLAALSEPSIADALEARGVLLGDLYDEIERLLPPRRESAVTLGPGAATDVLAFVQAASPRALLASPADVFVQLLNVPEVGVAFEKHGVPRLRPRPSLWRAHHRDPYRTPPNSHATTSVLLWNCSSVRPAMSWAARLRSFQARATNQCRFSAQTASMKSRAHQ